MTAVTDAQAQDAFTLLGLPMDATVADTKRAYRQAATRSHPDCSVCPDGTSFHAVQEAWETLQRWRQQPAYALPSNDENLAPATPDMFAWGWPAAGQNISLNASDRQ